MSPRCALPVVALVIATLVAHAVVAAPITFDIVAEVTSSDDSLCPVSPLSPCRVGPAGIIAGDHFAISYTFDSDTVGVLDGEGFVEYRQGPAFVVVVGLNDGMQFNPLNILVRPDIYPPDGYDEYRVTGGPVNPSPDSFYLELGARDNQLVFPTGALPLEPPSIDRLLFARGRVRTLEFRVVSMAVRAPEPSEAELVLVVGSLFSLRCARRCRAVR